MKKLHSGKEGKAQSPGEVRLENLYTPQWAAGLSGDSDE